MFWLQELEVRLYVMPSNPKEKDLKKRLNLIEKNIDDSLQAPSEETKKEIIYLKRHLARLSDESFKQSCAHNSLEPLKWREGMPMFDGVCYPSLLMRPNVNPSRGPHPRSVIAIDEGLNPMATAVDLDANVIVGGYGLCDYIRNADRKMRLIQGKIDTRGNLLAKEDFDALAIILRSSASSKVRNKASSKYDAKRALWIKHDPLCQYWKSQHEKIKENKEQKCSVAREEFATFVALFDVVIIGKNDLKKWHQNLSHASSSVLSAVSLGTLHEKIKFKVGLSLYNARLDWQVVSMWK